jgi:hypothetical protein
MAMNPTDQVVVEIFKGESDENHESLWRVDVRHTAAELDGQAIETEDQDYNVLAFTPAGAIAKVMEILTHPWQASGKGKDKKPIRNVLPVRIEIRSVRWIAQVHK